MSAGTGLGETASKRSHHKRNDGQHGGFAKVHDQNNSPGARFKG
jgi:hypothetical protein